MCSEPRYSAEAGRHKKARLPCFCAPAVVTSASVTSDRQTCCNSIMLVSAAAGVTTDGHVSRVGKLLVGLRNSIRKRWVMI